MKRPSFATAWSASQRIYDPLNPAEKVARLIGGYVEKNIRATDPKERWTNTCAIRMSYILNESGMHIPYLRGETASGADKRHYFFRVRNLISFLGQRWGKPSIVKYPETGGGPLVGQQGVILFEVLGWSDAAGHATLFDGRVCYDHCYFNEPGVNYRTERANFWSLP